MTTVTTSTVASTTAETTTTGTTGDLLKSQLFFTTKCGDMDSFVLKGSTQHLMFLRQPKKN